MVDGAASGTPLVARGDEEGWLAHACASAADGHARTLLVGGTAGVGKTSLWQAAVRRAGAAVAVGQCLPLVTVSVPFGAVRGAVASVSTPAEADAAVAPPEASVPARFDRWLDDRCARAPLVLVVEDLHCADQATLDVLLYVVAGPASRRLAIVGTFRSDEVAGADALRRWLADVRRLPRVEERALAPLDRAGTGDQLAALLGAPVDQGLVDDVFRRGGGVPLFTRLLAEGASPHDERAPHEVSGTLRDAVLRSWWRLDADARDTVALLAVGSGPLRPGDLARMQGREPDAVGRHLAAASAAGVVQQARDGTYWFRHPLNAEVLQDAAPADTRARWHRAFADALEADAAEDSTPARVTAIAEHRFSAGDGRAAFAWALRAADAQAAAGAPSEAARLLRRAVELRGQAAPDVPAAGVFRRLRVAAAAAGAFVDELDAVEGLLSVVSPDAEPLAVAELLVRRAHLRFSTGRAFLDPADFSAAVEISAAWPTSPEHALALAELAHAELWHDDAAGPGRAASALAAARASGDDRALAYALTASAMAALRRGDNGAAAALGAQAVPAALASGDWWGCVHAVFWETNALAPFTRPYADALRARRQELVAAGAPHALLSWVAVSEAGNRLVLGEWAECAALLRSTLVADPGPLADAAARLCAARLAAGQGRPREAEQHLARADELFSGGSRFLALEFDATRTLVRLGAGDPTGAFAAALAGLSDGVERTMCEWLVPLAARALADEARAAGDARGDRQEVLRRLDDFERRFPTIMRDMGGPTPAYECLVAGLAALLAAEVARARGAPGEAARWREAVEALAAAELAWELAYACWRGAEALLDGPGPGHDRALAADLLRRGLALAERLGAVTLQQELQALAIRARIPTGTIPTAAPTQARAAGLTAREAEILALLVAGRTYGEIARTLVISEKTVSSHVSHLLAKTGTANRVALAAFARRTGLVSG